VAPHQGAAGVVTYGWDVRFEMSDEAVTLLADESRLLICVGDPRKVLEYFDFRCLACFSARG